jgi:type IV pilus assembly protein PilQ
MMTLLLPQVLFFVVGIAGAPTAVPSPQPSQAGRLVALRVEPPKREAANAQGQAAAAGGEVQPLEGPAQARSIRLETSESPVYTVIRMTHPDRVIIDVADMEVGDLQVPPLDPQDPWFAAIDAQQLSSSPKIARLSVTLKEGTDYDVGREGLSIVLRVVGTAELADEQIAPPTRKLGPTRQQIAASALKRLSAPVPELAKPPVQPPVVRLPTTKQAVTLPKASRPAQAAKRPHVVRRSARVAQPKAAQAAAPKPPSLRGVSSLPGTGDKGRTEAYSLNVSPAADCVPVQTYLPTPPRLVVDLKGVLLPNLNPEVTLDRRLVRRVRLGRRPEGVRAVFDLNADDTVPKVERTARGFTVSFRRAPKERAPAVRRVASVAAERFHIAAATPQTASFMATARALARTSVGDLQRKISLDVRDMDIMNVLRLISEETGENIITSDDVKGRVTMRLRNVPADQALDTMLRTKGFDRVRQNNIIRIATGEAIQKERDLDLARRRSALEVEETIIRMETVNYATASEIVDQLKPMLTGRGSVQVNSRTNTLIIQDVPGNVERLIGLIRRLDKQTPLVMIQARIVEANTSSMQDLGIQWGGSSAETSRTHNPTGLMFPGDVVINGGADNSANQVAGLATPAHYAVNLPATLSGQGAGLGFILGSANGSQILNLRLSAMESNGNGKVISSPEVATLDNKTARVSQGVEIPVSVTSAAGVNTRFVPAVLELEVTPHVTNDGTVLLRIKTQKSEADFTNRGAAGDPTIQKRFAETEVLVRDGDTSVIGGIYTRNTGDTYNSVPFISRIPLIGSLFRRHAHQDTRAELLVFITPRIINREESMIQNTGK